MPKTRTAERRPQRPSRRAAEPPSRRAVEPPIAVSGRPAPLSGPEVAGAAATVLRAEGRQAVLSIAFVGRDRIRALNRRWKGDDRITDVIAFRLPTPGGPVAGDIYICAWQAAREAEAQGIPLREELLRLIIHGVLHVLGRDHPAGAARVRSPMWRRQEQLVRRVR